MFGMRMFYGLVSERRMILEKKFQRLKTEIFGQSMGWAEVLLAESEIVELIKEQNISSDDASTVHHRRDLDSLG